MKKNIFQLSMVFLFVLSLFSCEDVLNKKNLENLVEDDLWVEPVLLKGFMDNIMKDNLPGPERSISITDEGYGQYSLDLPYDILNINTGPSEIEKWFYSGIRNINMFLDNIDKCPETKLSNAEKNDYIAQMKVLRAYKYFQMVRVYGGVPLLLHAQSIEDDLYVYRAKTSECIRQIIQDLDDAIAMGDDFPMKRADADGGRINRAAALAIKGRVLLYYASPQFTKQTPAGTKDVNTRWSEAYAAHKAAI
ncbi:MAG: RagB/SusD family nutrient uptake outer membrane protein, partial [Dysgonamonadaceae bacterium]|nr:RagB/SusD family nutrient uptake outer membrane protein [Dysgonamonadaceae bacterium]